MNGATSLKAMGVAADASACGRSEIDHFGAKSIPTNLQVPSDRPGLVAFFNDAFARTFENAGLPPSATRIDLVYSSDLPGQQTPLAVW
jgi:hypothetical protein